MCCCVTISIQVVRTFEESTVKLSTTSVFCLLSAVC
jgi:hypothetical protein